MYLKINEELFLEKAELNRLVEGLEEKGYVFDKKTDTNVYGIVRNLNIDPLFDYFKIISSGTPSIFRIKEGYAYDKDRKVIHYKYPSNDITIPLPGQNYWVKIAHKYESREVGTVSIGGVNQGILTGVNTKFTDVLRGQPNFPSKIKFLNSVNYTLEYEVLEVISDTSAVIQGVFNIPESNLEYAVVGTFTYGYQPPTQDKEIFQYDSCEVTLVQDLGSLPSLILDKEFIIGRVSYTNAGLVIEDYRWMFIHNTLDREHVDSITSTQPSNPIVGIEYIKKISANSNSKAFYLIGFDWKFNIASESQNNAISEVDITSGSGGCWTDITSFQNGDFDGWRYYYDDGNYSTIIASVLQGSNIKLTLDSVRIGSGNGKYVTPNAEDIEIYYSFMNGATPIYKRLQMFGIAMDKPCIHFSEDDVLYAAQEIDFHFCYKNHFLRTEVLPFNSSTYINQAGFNSSGVLVDPSQTTTSTSAVLQNTVSSNNKFVPKKIPLPWYPTNVSEVTSNFDTAGLGTSAEFSGWAICNGLNGTPDLRGKFIVGTINNTPNSGAPALAANVDPSNGHPNYSVASEGGTTKETLTTSQIPSHNHGGSTSSAGAHNHTITDPGHIHGILGQNGGGGLSRARTGTGNTAPTVNTESSVTGISLAAVSDHSHSISSEGGGGSHNNLPPYYSLMYVMRIS